jgi:hypothetical protein
LPADGGTVPSIASILVVFSAFGVATIVVLWLMDMLAEALRRRIIDRGGRYPEARQSPTTEPERTERPTRGDAQEEGKQRSWWRRPFGR